MTRLAVDKPVPKSGVHVFDFLRDDRIDLLPPIVVIYGTEPFLRDLAIRKLTESSGTTEGTGYRRWEGDTADWPDVRDALRSQSLFDATPSVVLIDDADPFITACRSQLEAYTKQPSTGRLVLCPKSWPRTTRLYQLVKDGGGWLIDCNLPQRTFGKTSKVDRRALVSWLVERAQSLHKIKTDAKTVEYLCDLAGESPGRIEQEFAKLASYVGPGKRVTLQHVSEVGCGWQLRTTWDLVERVVEGDAAAAIGQLQRLIQGGEEPLAVLGAMSWTLRRLAAAARHAEWRMRRGGPRNLAESLRAAGFRNDYGETAPVTAERQLQQLGWQRCRSLLRRLVECDLRLKGSHSSPTDARRLLEGLILELSKQARAAALPSSSPRAP